MQHGTLVLVTSFAVPVARVYAAVSEPLERARIGILGDELVTLIDESDFRVGGRNVYRFGPKGSPDFRAETLFHRIVAPSLIVATEIVHAGEACVSIDLVSLAFSERAGETDLKLTAQVLSLGPDDVTDVAGARHQAFIDALGRYLGAPARGQRHSSTRR
ncbi:MAG: SRPBCC domain-containing protein [Hyphomicrobiaceae bacterium]